MTVIDPPQARCSAAQMAHLFPAPVIFLDWPDSEALNAALKEVVLRRRERSPGVVKTNRGGWQSTTDLQKWQEPPVQVLVGRILELAQEYVARQIGRRDSSFETGWEIRAWANVNEHGHFNRTHDHLGQHSFFSGVYYVNVGDLETGNMSGRTRFEDWTRVAIDTNTDPDALRRDYLMTPRNGRMLMFPASLMHSVEPYGGHAQRITIAFNLYHPGFAVPRLAEHLQQADWWWTNFRGLVLLKRKIPEKFHALGLLPGQLAKRRIDNPLSLAAWRDHFATAFGHATALASERFERQRNG